MLIIGSSCLKKRVCMDGVLKQMANFLFRTFDLQFDLEDGTPFAKKKKISPSLRPCNTRSNGISHMQINIAMLETRLFEMCAYASVNRFTKIFVKCASILFTFVF